MCLSIICLPHQNAGFMRADLCATLDYVSLVPGTVLATEWGLNK